MLSCSPAVHQCVYIPSSSLSIIEPLCCKGGVSQLRPTAISPNTSVIGIYILVLYMMQLGYCILLVLATKNETKKALTKAVGLSLIFSNFIMAIWAITWVRFASVIQNLANHYYSGHAMVPGVDHITRVIGPLLTLFQCRPPGLSPSRLVQAI